MAIRILHVVNYMGRGGIETMLMNYYRNIDRDKVQFDFLTHRKEEWDYDKEIQEFGGKIYHLPRLNPFDPVYLRALDHFFKSHPEYKIVHSHFDCMAGIPLKYAKKNGVPVRIAHAHSSNQVENYKYLLKLYFKKNIPTYSNIRFACSKMAGDWMFNGAKYHILHNAIDARKYIYDQVKRCGMREQLGINQDAFVVGEVASLSPPKNHSFLIDIFDEIIKIRTDAVLLIVGEGPLYSNIKEKVDRLNLSSNVIFTGLRDDIPELLQAMDVFVMPSIFEGLGVAAIEAQAAGLPCIISDKVPMECSITSGLVQQVSLSENAHVWAEEIMNNYPISRDNTYKQIVDADYDIIRNAARLQRFYLSLYNKYNN